MEGSSDIMLKRLPGQRHFESPEASQAERLVWLRPFVRQSGDEVRPPWFLGNRRLLDYLLVYIESGSGTFTVGSATFSVTKGSLIWVPPNVPHQMRGTAAMRCLWFHFDLIYDPARSHWDACIPAHTMDLSPWSAYIHPPVNDPEISAWQGLLNVHNTSEVRDLVFKICRAHTQSPARKAALAGSLLAVLVNLISNGLGAGDTRSTSQGSKMRVAAEHIRADALSVINFETLAYSYGLSETHFRRSFKAVNGISPGKLQQQVKLQKACERLSYSGDSVTRIARYLGYTTVHNFSRAFSTQYGLSPRQYRCSSI